MEIFPIVMIIIWIIVMGLIVARPNHQVTLIDYFMCWLCLMIMIIKDIVR